MIKSTGIPCCPLNDRAATAWEIVFPFVVETPTGDRGALCRRKSNGRYRLLPEDSKMLAVNIPSRDAEAFLEGGE